MNNILKEVEVLKSLIISSDEYKEYNKYLKKIENNNEINELIGKIKKLQKEIVNLKSKNISTDEQDNKLKQLNDDLYNYSDYNNYINSSKKLNILITKIQKNFEDYFNSLIS